MKKAVFLVVCLILVGCGGRKAHPVATTNDYDKLMSCDQLRAERSVNISKMASLQKERADDRDNNVGSVLAAPILLPLSLDLSSTGRVEAEALTKRNVELDRLITEKCPAIAPPAS